MRYHTLHTLVKISLGSIFLMILGVIALYFKILDRKYVEAIIYGNILVHGTVLLFRLKKRLTKQKDVEMLRCQFKNKFIKEYTNILPEHICPTNTRKPSIFKIYWEAYWDANSPPQFVIEMMGNNGKVISDIKSRIIYINTKTDKGITVFNAEIKVMPNEKINFQFRKDVNIELFTLKEIYIL